MIEDRLVELSESGEPELRRQAVASAANEPGQLAREMLLTCLGDENWRVRKEAAAGLGKRVDDREEIVEALVQAFFPGENVGLRNGAVEALGSFGGLAIRTIAREIKNLDADGRKLAVEAVARTNHKEALPLLRDLLSDEDVNVRAAALEATADLGHLAPGGATGILTSGLALGDPYLSLVALDALGRLESTVPWETLEPLLKNPMLEGPALRIASRLGDPRAAQAIVRHLDVSRGQTWSVALCGLTRFADSSEDALHAAQSALNSLSEQGYQRLREKAEDTEDTPRCSDALLALAMKGSPYAAEIAFCHLGHDYLASAAHRALSLLGQSALPTLRARLGSANPLERVVSVEFISRALQKGSTDARLLTELRELSLDPSPVVVRAWLTSLLERATPEDLEPALAWLRDGAPQHVRRAALFFARSAVDRFPEVTRALVAGIAPSSARAAWVAAFISSSDAAFLDSPAADLAYVTAAVSIASEGVRSVAIEALAKFNSHAAAEAVAFALNDEATSVQLTAVRILGTLGASDDRRVGTQRLVELAQTSADPTLVVAALQSLGNGQDPVALDLLSNVAADGNAWRAVAALEALVVFPVEVRGERAAVALLGQRADVARTALEAIVELNGGSEPELLACLNHQAWGVRCLAADLIAIYCVRPTGSRVKEALRRQMSLEQRQEVLAALNRALALLEESVEIRLDSPPGGDDIATDGDGVGGVAR